MFFPGAKNDAYEVLMISLARYQSACLSSLYLYQKPQEFVRILDSEINQYFQATPIEFNSIVVTMLDCACKEHTGSHTVLLEMMLASYLLSTDLFKVHEKQLLI